MREIPKPHQGARLFVSCVALWRCDEAAANTALADSSAQATNLTSFVTTPVAPGLFAAGALTGARGTSASGFFTGASTSAQRISLAQCTVEMWVRPTSLTGTACLLRLGDPTATASSVRNTILQLELLSTGAVRWLHQNGTRNDVSGTSSAGLIAAGQTRHIALTRETAGAGLVDYRLYVDGALAQTWLGVAAPTGGNNVNVEWNVGINMLVGGDSYTGLVDDIRVLAGPLPASGVLETYTRGLREVDQVAVRLGPAQADFTRVRAQDSSGIWHELTELGGQEWAVRARIRHSNDEQVAQCTLEVVRETYQLSVAPGAPATLPNLLRLKARVEVYVSTQPYGAAPPSLTSGDWECLFAGEVVDVDWSRSPATVSCADHYSDLQDTWIEPIPGTPPQDKGPYGSVGGLPMQGELQKVIDDNAPAGGYLTGPHVIWVPTSPGVNVRQFITPPTTHVGGQLDEVVQQIGWCLRYRWHDDTQRFRLTLFEPERTKTYDPATDTFIAAQDILEIRRLSLSRADIRNVIEVEYGDAVTEDDAGAIVRQTVTVVDAASIAAFGRRYARIGLDSTRQLNNLTGATRLANAVLGDLKLPRAELQVDMRLRPDIETFDLVRLEPDGIHLFEETDCAVVEVEHDLHRHGRTRLTLRQGPPQGQSMIRWQDVLTERGRNPGRALNPPPAPTGLGLVGLPNGARVTWAIPKALSRAYRETEIHVSATPAFTPSQATLAALARGRDAEVHGATLFPAGATRYVRVRHRDEMGNFSAPTLATPMTPRGLPSTSFATATIVSAVTWPTASWQAINWAFPIFNPSGALSGTTYTCTFSGAVQVSARVHVDANGKANSDVRLRLTVNGAVWREVSTLATGSPVRARLELEHTAIVGSGDLLQVQLLIDGNVGQQLLTGLADTHVTFAPIGED